MNLHQATAPTQQRRCVFVACKDSRATAEAVARRCSVDPSKVLILSRRDNPELHTFEDIVTALPPSTRMLVLDDVEYLLPEGRRDPASVRAFLLDLKARYGHRFNLIATMGDPSAARVYHEVLRDAGY